MRTLPFSQEFFGYRAAEYDLAAYEEIMPGAKSKIWNMIQSEETHQVSMAERRAKLAERQSKGFFTAIIDEVKGWLPVHP